MLIWGPHMKTQFITCDNHSGDNEAPKYSLSLQPFSSNALWKREPFRLNTWDHQWKSTNNNVDIILFIDPSIPSSVGQTSSSLTRSPVKKKTLTGTSTRQLQNLLHNSILIVLALLPKIFSSETPRWYWGDDLSALATLPKVSDSGRRRIILSTIKFCSDLKTKLTKH